MNNETADALVSDHFSQLNALARQVWDDPKLLNVYRSPATSGAHVDLESTIRNTTPVGCVVDYRAETSPDVPPGTLVVRVCSHGRTE